MGFCLVYFMCFVPIVGEMGSCEVGHSCAVLNTIDISHGDEIEVDLPFERVEFESLEKVLNHTFHYMGTVHVAS